MRTRWKSAALAGLALAASPCARAGGPEDSIVQVVSKIREPNVVRPWSRQNAVEVMGTGVILDGQRVLTNAHLAQYASEVSVQGRGGGDRYDAKVEFAGPGIDLAVLTVDDPTFFEKRPPMPRSAARPASNVAVEVYGFSIGGNGLASTRGVLSRVDWASYDNVQGLRFQIDAATNPGASGAPVLVDGRMVGLIFSQLDAAENVGYAIPNEEIDLFLDDVKDGHYDGKYRVEGEFQVLENEALRASLGLDRAARGVMVRKPAQDGPSSPLLERDVITRVGGTAIDNEGMVVYEGSLRLPFMALVPKLAREGRLKAEVIRGGKPLEVDLPLVRDRPSPLRRLHGRMISYFVYGPLVFTPAYFDTAAAYLRANPAAGALSPLLTKAGGPPAFPGEELVIVGSPMLPHRIAKGYSEPIGYVVADVDGVKVKNFGHLVELLRDGKGEFTTFRFQNLATETIVFRRKAAETATAEILADSGIPRRGSDDALALWEKRPAAPK